MVRAKHNGTQKQQNKKGKKKIYLDSLGKKINYYSFQWSGTMLSCNPKVFYNLPMFSSKHFRKSLKLDLCVWKGITAHLLHFTIHIKTAIMPSKYVGENKSWIPIFLALVSSQMLKSLLFSHTQKKILFSTF